MGHDQYDPETGEVPYYPVINCETGEIEIFDECPKEDVPKIKFRIPKYYLEECSVDAVENIDEIAKTLFLTPHCFDFGPEENKQETVQSVPSQDATCEFTKVPSNTVCNSHHPKVHPLIDPVIQYTLNVINVVLYLWAQRQRTSLQKLRISDIYYQSLVRSFFRNIAPLMRNKHVKRKSIKYGLQCVKRVRVF